MLIVLKIESPSNSDTTLLTLGLEEMLGQLIHSVESFRTSDEPLWQTYCRKEYLFDWTFKYLEEAMGAAKCRAFFITENGYMGLEPIGVKEKDVVCMIFGCKTLIILRKTPIENHYLVVGDVYVYGMMRGELVVDLEDGRLEAETIHLV
jgi:hypothetical protein